MPTIPVDGRRQFSMSDLVPLILTNGALGRPLMAGAEPVGYGSGMYTLAGSWPTPTPTNRGGGGFSPAAEAQPPPGPSRSAAGALALWPNLK
jgi:hypothetical protein